MPADGAHGAEVVVPDKVWTPLPALDNFTGLKKKDPGLKAVWRVVLKSDELYVDNTLDEPCAIVPAEASFTGEGKTLEANVPALSFTIFILEK